MEKLNIAEILKDCPQGMELDCTLYDNCTFEGIEDIGYINILVKTPNGQIKLSKEGCIIHNCNSAKCVIFPKGKTTWEGFQRPFNNGDIIKTITNNGYLFYSIYEGIEDKKVLTYIDYVPDENKIISIGGVLCLTDEITEQRFATEEEEQQLFDAIKANGYKWNFETKTLEKLIEPKFKVGDVVRLKSKPSYIYTIHCLTWDDNKKLAYKLLPKNDKHLILVSLNIQDNYELVSDKFDVTALKPFDKVLVRLTKYNVWSATFFSHYDKEVNYGCYPFVTTSSKSYSMCIPYEGNEHLLGTTNDCDEFYKNWE